MIARRIVSTVIRSIRQRRCQHEGYLTKMLRRLDGKIECPCNKCGKLLVADYGLALPLKWVNNDTA